MKPADIQPGDVVQISPDLENCFFPGCFMIVTEPKVFGAQGFILIPKTRTESPGRAFFRCKWEDMELVGRAAWAPAPREEEGGDILPLPGENPGR